MNDYVIGYAVGISFLALFTALLIAINVHSGSDTVMTLFASLFFIIGAIAFVRADINRPR
jgi:hypothetical protein